MFEGLENHERPERRKTFGWLPRHEPHVEAMERRIMLSLTQPAQAELPGDLDASNPVEGKTAAKAKENAAAGEVRQSVGEIVYADASLQSSLRTPAGAEVVWLGSGDPLGQITAHLAGRSDVRAVHLVTHGSAGRLHAGGADITLASVADRAGEVASWSQALANDAVIAVYGCDVAADANGRDLIDAMAHLTGATAVASSDATGARRFGGDYEFEYVAGDASRLQALRTARAVGMVLATYTLTPSGGTTTASPWASGTVVDASLSIGTDDGAATLTSATARIASGFRTSEDLLQVTSAGVTTGFDANTGTLTMTAAAGKTAAQWQAVMRLIEYRNSNSPGINLGNRGVTFTLGGTTSAAKAVAVEVTMDAATRTRALEALTIVNAIGAAISGITSDPFKGDTTEVPGANSTISDLLYPNQDEVDSNGNAIPDYTKSIQPARIGDYIQVHSAGNTYLGGAGAASTFTGLAAALETRLGQLVTDTVATRTVSVTATAAQQIAMTLTVNVMRGDDKALALADLERDLGMRLPAPPNVSSGGGADIQITFTFDMAGHVDGGALAQNKVRVNFVKLQSIAGISFDDLTTDVEVGVIRGQLVNADGFVGATFPLTLTGGNSRTIDAWATDGSNVAGFSTRSGSASLTLPISASIGGVSATTANTKVVVADDDIFDDDAATYTTTDYNQLLYFANLSVEDVIQEVLKVGQLYSTLSNSGEALFGVNVPFLDRTELGELFDFASLFDSAIGSKIDVYEPVLNTAGRDVLTDWRLPVSSDSTPVPSMYSDLRAGFSFGVVINDAWPIHTVTIAADGTRNTLDDLVTDVNAAFTAAGLNLVSSNVSNKLSIKASHVSVQKFAVVPVAPAADRLSPITPPADLSGIALNTPKYYTVTGTTTGSVTGTNYYTVGTPLGAAAVHAGILADGEIGVVKVTRIGSTGVVLGSNRNGITSAFSLLPSNVYLIETAVNDVRRLGIVAYGEEMRVLEQVNSGSVRATLPLPANLSGDAHIVISSGGTDYTVTVTDHNRSDILDTLADVQAALVTANIPATTLSAGLVDDAGNLLEGEPEANTDYYLSLYVPTGSPWSAFELSPTGDATAYRVLPLGFMSGDVSAQPRPSALRTFADFANASLFPGLSMTPVYDNVAGTVTMQFTATGNTTPTVDAGFGVRLSPLSGFKATNASLSFTPSVTSNLAFGLEFKIGPSNPVSLPSGTSIPTDGRLGSVGSGTLVYDFDTSGDDGADLDGWTDTMGTSSPVAGGRGADRTNGEDGQHHNLIFSSPQFYLTGSGDLTFFLSGGTGQGSSPLASPYTNISQIPNTTSTTSGQQIVGLRRVSDGAYVITKQRSGASNTWQQVTITAAELSAYVQPGVAYQLDLIETNHGGWGHTEIDDVSIPGTLVSAGGGNAVFTLDFVLQDRFTVTVPTSWTTGNNHIQDLISDINRALKQTINSSGQTVDLTTDRLIARRMFDSGQLELITATPTNGGAATSLSHTNGVLSSDFNLTFTHDGEQYELSVAASATTANTSFADLLVDLNDALTRVIRTSDDAEVTLAADVFFTTIADASGATTNQAYLYATSPAGSAWPSTITLSADRTNAAVTVLGFDDGGTGDVSSVTVKASGASTRLRNHTNGSALASGVVNMVMPSFAGSVAYGFNTLNFSGTTGGTVSAAAGVKLANGVDASVEEIGGSSASVFDRTLTGHDGSGLSRAGMTLTGISAASGASIQNGATIAISIPDLSAMTVIVDAPIGVPIPVPGQTAGVVTQATTVNFLYEGIKYSITVPAGATTANASFADLAADFNAGLASCTRTISGVATANFDASALFTITPNDEQLQINAKVPTGNPNYAAVSFLPGIGAFGEVGLQGSFGLGTVADSLRSVLPVLDTLQDGLDPFSKVTLPLINAKVNELIDVKGDLALRLDSFADMSAASPAELAPALAAALSVPSEFVRVTFDNANNAYRVDLQFETGIATTRTLDMTLADFYRFAEGEAPANLSRLVDTGSRSPLTVKIKATTVLSVGIDLTDAANPRTFLYAHDGSGDLALADGDANGTSINLEIEAFAEDINFTASVGAFGVFVREGNARLGGPVSTHVSGDPLFTFDEDARQLHFVRESDAASVSATLKNDSAKYYLDPQGGEADASDLDNYDSAYAGTVEVNLPLFTPTEFINPFTNRTVEVRIQGQGLQEVHPGGNVFNLQIPDLGAYAGDLLAAEAIQSQINAIYTAANGNLDAGQQAQTDALTASLEAMKSGENVAIFTPDVDDANSGVRAPTVLDLLRDPAIIVDGVDVLLGAVETGLRGLDNLNIPVIGPTLGSAVDSVFQWRQGWLLDLKHQLRGSGEAVFETAKNEIFEFLGPAGLDLLLKDNGVRSVEGMIQADSPDDVTLDFLDEDGEKMTDLGGYGAHAVEFKVRLGSVLLDTGTDISFNFDSLKPAFSLGIDGGLTFKLGWDITLGFGISLEDGFYVVVDSDPVANELELRFEAGLSGVDDDFTVAEDATSPTGYSIKDAAGNWVNGPRQGDGSTPRLHVMPVYEDGDTAVFGPGEEPPMPEDCENEHAPGEEEDEHVYWVVAANNGSGTWVPAYLDKLGFYRPQAGSAWSAVNGSGSRNPDKMVLFSETAPFAAFGSLFFFNLTAVDPIRQGLQPIGDAEYFYDPSAASTVTSYGRNNAEAGVNRNNNLPTRIAGRIGVNIQDPSSDAGDYVARPGPTVTGFMLMDGTDPIGGQPVLDGDGNLTPVRYENGQWYVVELREGAVDITNPANYDLAGVITDDPSENRLTFSELRQAGVGVFEFKLNAEAVVNLKLVLFVSDNANIPRLTAAFNLDWRSDSMVPPPNPFAQTTEQKRDLVPEVGLNDIRLDLGSFLTKLIKPIAEKIDSTLKPVDPLFDVLKARLPVLSDIAGRDIKLTTLLVQFGGPKGQAIGTVIEMAILVRELSAVMAAVPAGANVYLPIGNFWLAKVGAGPLGQPGLGKQIYYDNSEVSAPSITQRNQSMIAESGTALNSVTNALGKLDEGDRDSSSQPGISNQNDRGGFKVPILQDPITIFKLLMGEDVPLVTFSLPKLDFSMQAQIPLVRIVIFEVGLRFDFQVRGQLAMGYDTYGIRLFSQSHDPLDFLHGFYVSDRANADGTGADVDEFYLRATIALYGGVDVYLARAGIEGGFTFTARINLNDPNNDGKLRVMEAIELVKYTGNPLDLADLHFSGEVFARYYYWVGIKIWTPWKTYRVTLTEGGKTFARMTVFSFTRDGRDGPPNMASLVTTVDPDGNERANSLLVHIGPNASKRVSNEDPLKTLDGAERVKLWNNGSTVYVQYLNYSGTYTATYNGVQRVVIHGGDANDQIDASGLNGLPVEIDGGAGNDTISLGSGHASMLSLLKGGSGDDSITVTGGGTARLDGDDGNDTIIAGTGDSIIDPGSGNDTITGGGSGSTNRFVFRRNFGLNTLNLSASALVNLIDLINSTLPATFNLSGGGSTVYAGETNRVTFDLSRVTEIRGTDGRDVFNITDPTTRNANSGKGLILRGGPGTDAFNFIGNSLGNVATDGITVDDGIRSVTQATVSSVEVDECGHIKRIKLASGGSGYAVPPEVIITDDTGSGARAVAGIDENGTVTGVVILGKGNDYSATPSVTLVERTSYGDVFSYTSDTTGTVSVDRAGNGGADYRVLAGGKSIKFVGWTAPGSTRPDGYGISETDNLTFNLPTGTLSIDAPLDVQDTLTVTARRVDQNATITADTVRITTERGVAVDHPIDVSNNGDVVLRTTGRNIPNYLDKLATGSATVVDGAITHIAVTNAGGYYDFAPTVTIQDDRGYGARAVATINGSGQVTGITVLDGGYGYLSTPAPKVVIAPPTSIQFNAHVTTSTVNSDPGTGDGRGTVNLRAELGAVNMSGDVTFPVGSNIEWKHGDFHYTRTDSLDDITPADFPATVGGSGATAQAVLDGDGRVVKIDVISGGTGYSSEFLPVVLIEGAATATAIVNDVTGAITGFNITYPGEGYPSAPEVTIQANGFGKVVGADPAGTAINRAHIKSAGGNLVAVAYYGIGDPSKPLKTDIKNMVAQTFAEAAGIHVLEKDGVRIGLMDHVNGLNTVDGDASVTAFAGAVELGSPIQQTNSAGELLWQDAEKTIPIYARDEQGNILYEGGRIVAGDGEIKLTGDDITVNSYVSAQGGKLTLQPTKANAEIGLNGTRARASVAITNGQVTSFPTLWSGRGYKSAPLVIITPPGERAFGVANIANGQVGSIKLTYGGKGYNASHPPTVTLTGGGVNGATPATPAGVEADYVNGIVTGFRVTSPGSGYITAPKVNVALPGVQATASATIAGGKVTALNILNPGANYSVPPAITVAAPYPFSLEAEEIAYFQEGFDNIVIGREDGSHIVHSAAAEFADGVTIRAPRAGGDVQMENLSVGDGPVVIVGSGHTLNMTSAAPNVTGTFVEIDDNVVVHDGVNATIVATTGHVSVFGTAKGKIDGVVGSTSENLTITDVGNVLVTGAIGSTHPINDLTINSTGAGTITLQQNVTLEGDLHIVKGGNITFGGNLVIAGNLIIDEGASVSFNGSVTVTGNVTIAKATTVTFGQNVSVSGNFLVGDANDHTKISAVTFASTARLDVDGTAAIYATNDVVFGNRVGNTLQPTTLTVRSEAGDVTFQGAVNVTGGTLTVTKARDLTFAQELTADVLNVPDASGQTRFQRATSLGTMTVVSTSLIQVQNRLDLTAGSATLTTNEIAFDGGSQSIAFVGGGSSTLTIQPRTTSRAITIGSPPGIFTALDVSDVDVAAIAAGFTEVVIGDAAAGTGLVTIGSVGTQQGAGNSQFLNSTIIHGGAIAVVQDIDSAATSGVLRLVARAGTVNIGAKINATASERSNIVRIEATGAVAINQAVYAGSAIQIVAGGSVIEDANGLLSAPDLRISAGGAVTLMNAGNALSTVAINAGNNAVQLRDDTGFAIGTVDGVSGINSGSANTSLTSNGGTVTQTQAITAAGLALLGTGGTFTLTNTSNNVATLAASTGAVSYTDADALAIGTVAGTVGMTSSAAVAVTAATALAVDQAITTSNGGAVTLTAQSGAITIAAAGDINADGAVTLNATTGINTAGDVTTTNDAVHFAAPATNLSGAVSIFTNGGTGDVTFDGTIDGGFALEVGAGTGNVLMLGDVGATTPLSSLQVSSATTARFAGDVFTMDSQSVTAGTIRTNGTHSAGNDAIAFTGELRLEADTRLDTGIGAGNITLGSIVGGGYNLQLHSGAGTTTVSNAISGVDTLTLQDDSATSSGAVALQGDVDIETLVTHGRGYNVSLTGSDVEITDAVAYLNTGSVTLGNHADDVLRFVGGVVTTGSATNPSITNLGGTIRTPATHVRLGEVELTADAAIDTTDDGSSPIGEDILFTDAVNGPFDLKLTSGSANVAFNGAVGVDLPLGEIEIAEAGHVTASASIIAGSIVQHAGSGTTTFNGPVTTLTGSGLHLTGTNFAFNASVGTQSGGGVTIVHTGTLTIAAAADMLLDGMFDQAGVGAVQTAGDITTTGDTILFAGPVTLTGNVALSTGAGAGDVHFASTLDGTHNLSITAGAGAGDVDFDAAVGGTTPLADVTIHSADTLKVSGTFVAEDVTVAAAKDVTIAGATSVATFTQTAGTGTTAINAALSTSGAVSVTAAAITMGASGSIETDDANVTLTADTGAFAMTAGSSIDAGAGEIAITAEDDITLSTVTTTNATADALAITSDTGGVINAGDASVTANASGAVTTVRVAAGFGAAAAIDTQIATLDLVSGGGGDVRIDEADAITLTQLATPTGDVVVTAGAGIVATDVSADAGNITLEATTGNISVSSVAASGGVGLIARAGSILDSGASNTDAITAAAVALTARTGIGTSGDRIDVVAPSVAARVYDLDGSAASDGDIYLLSSYGGGATTATELSTATGTVDVQHSGSDLAVVSTETGDGPIILQVTGADLAVISAAAGGDGDIALTTVTSGDIAVESIAAADDAVTITSAGDIRELDPDSGVDIATGTLTLDAAGAIGVDTAGEPSAIELDVDHLDANAAGGPIYLASVGGMEVTALAASGDIHIASDGTVVLNAAAPIRSDLGIAPGAATSRDITFDAHISLAAATTISTGAGVGDITVTGTVGGTGALTVEAGTGDLRIDGAIATPASVTVSSATEISFGDTVAVGAGGMDLNAADLIEFEAAVTAAGDIDMTVQAVAGIIRFDRSVETTGGIAVDTVSEITFGGTAEAGAGGMDLTATDLIKFVGAVTAAGDIDLEVGASGEIRFDAAVETTGAITVPTAQTVSFGGTVEVGAGGMNLTAADLIKFEGALTAGGNIALAATAASGEIRFDDSVETTGSLTVTDAAEVSFGDAVTAGTGGMGLTVSDLVEFFGAVTAGGNVTMAVGAANGEIRFDSTFETTGSLTVTTAKQVTFAGTVEAGTGGMDLTATNLIEYDGAVTAGGDIDLAVISATGEVVFDSSVQTTGALNIASAAEISFASTVTVGSGGMDLTALNHIAFSGAVNVAGHVSLTVDNAANTGTLTISDDFTTTNGGNLTVDHDGTATIADGVALNISGTTSFVGTGRVIMGAVNYTTGGSDLSFAGPVDLSADATINTGGGDLTFTNVVRGAHDLTIDAGTGSVRFEAAVGSTTPLASLTISDADDVTFLETVAVSGAMSVTVDGDVTLTKAATVGGALGIDAGGLVSIQKPVNVTGNMTVAHDGTLTIAPAATITVGSAFHEQGPGAVQLGAVNIIAATAEFDGGITLGGAVTVITTAVGGVAFDGTINGAQTLALVAGGGDVRIAGAVGGTTPLTALMIESARNVNISGAAQAVRIAQAAGIGATVFNAATTTSGPQGIAIRNAQVTVNGDLLTTGTGPVTLQATGDALTITAAGSIDSAGRITVTAADLFTLTDGATMLARNAADVIVTGERVALGSTPSAIGGTGLLVLQPLSAARQIAIGGAGSQFELSQAELNVLGGNFSHIVIGRGTASPYNSGTAGTHAIAIGNAEFRSDVTIRSPGTGGSITVSGDLGTSVPGKDIVLLAGGDVTVTGTIQGAAVSSGVGQVGAVAGGTGGSDVFITGNRVLIGTAGNDGVINAPAGSVFLKTTSASGQIIGAGATSTITAGQSVVVGDPDGGAGTPGHVHLEGDVAAGGDISVRSLGRIELSKFRHEAQGRIDMVANNGFDGSEGTLVARTGPVKLTPDADANGTGQTLSFAMHVSDSTTNVTPLSLRTVWGKVKLPKVQLPGDTGTALVTVFNDSNEPIEGRIDLVVYASSDGVLSSTDRVIGRADRFVRLKAGKAVKLPLNMKVPDDLAVGTYRLIAEALPYREGGATGNDPNVAIKQPGLDVRLPAITARISSSFQGRSLSAGQGGKVQVELVNTGGVAASGLADVIVYATPDGTLDDAVELGRLTRLKVSLQPDKSKRLNMSVIMPSDLDGGSYSLLAEVQLAGVAGVTSEGAEFSVTGAPFELRAAA